MSAKITWDTVNAITHRFNLLSERFWSSKRAFSEYSEIDSTFAGRLKTIRLMMDACLFKWVKGEDGRVTISFSSRNHSD